MTFVLVLIAVAAILLISWAVFRRRSRTEKSAIYVCDKCGERDCDCSLEKDS
jgi:hypothetical protein